MTDYPNLAHADDAFAARYATCRGNATYGWRDRDGRAACEYCGSWSVPELLAALRDYKVRLEAADWKYGWPHKFYVHWLEAGQSWGGKFYNLHFRDVAGTAEFDEFSDQIWCRTGVQFLVEDETDRLMWKRQPHPSWVGTTMERTS